MDDLSAFCCQNPDCPDYGKRGVGNLSVSMRYGPEKRRRMLYCRTCKSRFSERKGTPLFDTRLPEEKVVSILAHVGEGCGVRKTSRLVGVSKDTVTRYCLRAGEHAQQLHDELVAFSPGDARGAVRRKVGVRGKEGEAL
jgi:LacI family transcriptional regulator